MPNTTGFCTDRAEAYTTEPDKAPATTERSKPAVWAENTRHDRQHDTTHTHFGGLDRREGVASELQVDLSPAEVVHNHNIVSLVAEVQRGGPAAKAIASKDDNLFRLGTVGLGKQGCR